HAPALAALGAGVRRVRGVALERRHPDDGLRRLVLAGLHVRARQLAAETAGALLRVDREDSAHRFFRPLPFSPPRSRRPMNSSSGRAAMVIIWTEPLAPNSTDTREIVALSGASTTVTKS